MYLQQRKRIIAMTKEIITKEVPNNAKLHVAVGDVVSPETILADYETSGGFRIFHLSVLLGVKGKDVERKLIKQIGDKVYKNEVIATTQGFFPWQTHVFSSPVDGIIKSISQTGDVTVSMLPKRVSQASYFWGSIREITLASESEQKGDSESALDVPLNATQALMTQYTSTTKIVIETQVAKVLGVMGSGKSREGRLALVSEASGFVLPQHMDETLQNALVVSGAILEHGVLERALQLQVSGILAGGIHLRDATSLGIKSRGSEKFGTDIGISILITEGFGPVTMGDDHYSVLQKYNGRYCILDGNTSELVIPLKPDEGDSITVMKNENDTERVEAKKGMHARLLSRANLGIAGIITALGDKEETLASGCIAQTVTVAITKPGATTKQLGEVGEKAKPEALQNAQTPQANQTEEITVPATNVEVIQN